MWFWVVFYSRVSKLPIFFYQVVLLQPEQLQRVFLLFCWSVTLSLSTSSMMCLICNGPLCVDGRTCLFFFLRTSCGFCLLHFFQRAPTLFYCSDCLNFIGTYPIKDPFFVPFCSSSRSTSTIHLKIKPLLRVKTGVVT